MPVSHVLVGNPNRATVSALQALQRFVAARPQADAVTDFERFEIEVHELAREVEREILADELAKLDADVPVIEVEGDSARQVVRCAQDYFTAAGKVRVMRNLFRPHGGGETHCPLELRAGIVAGRWTPLAAKQACWVTAHLPPGDGADLFALMGGMSPSSSSLDRLPKKVGARWEADRQDFDELVREGEFVPLSVSTLFDGLAVTLIDGVPGSGSRTL